MLALDAGDDWWLVPIGRAIPAIGAGLFITFSADHSSKFGLLVFGGFAVLTAITIVWGSRVLGRATRGWMLLHAAASLGCGIAAFIGHSAGIGVLFAVLITFGATTGVVEIVLGLRMCGRIRFSNDWIITGVLGCLLALVVLVIPIDLANHWQVAGQQGDVVSGVVTADVFLVGVLGAYCIVLGVFLVIAGISAHGAGAPKTDAPAVHETGVR